MFGALFGGTKTIDDLKTEDIRDEKVKLEVQEQQLSRKLRSLDAEKAKAFRDAAGSKGSRIDDRITARRVQSLGTQITDLQRQALDVSQRVMALDRLLRTKQRQRELDRKGLWSDISKMSMDSLEDELTGINVQDEQARVRVREINQILGVDEATLAAEEPAELRDIMDQIAAARESGNVDEALADLERGSGEGAHTV